MEIICWQSIPFQIFVSELSAYGSHFQNYPFPTFLKNVKDRNWDTVGWRVWANRFVLVTRFPIGVRSYGHADVALGCWPLASVVLSLSRRGSILRRSGLASETGATVRVFSAKNNKQTQLTTPRPGSYLPPAS